MYRGEPSEAKLFKISAGEISDMYRKKAAAANGRKAAIERDFVPASEAEGARMRTVFEQLDKFASQACFLADHVDWREDHLLSAREMGALLDDAHESFGWLRPFRDAEYNESMMMPGEAIQPAR